jgi:hypothetical protein
MGFADLDGGQPMFNLVVVNGVHFGVVKHTFSVGLWFPWPEPRHRNFLSVQNSRMIFSHRDVPCPHLKIIIASIGSINLLCAAVNMI